MSAPTASIFVALGRSGACIRIIGRANFTISVDFKALVNGLLEKGHKHFVLDLSECLLMDSTFLGVLAGLSLRLVKGQPGAGAACLGLYQPNTRIRDQLDSLGVLHLFQVVQEPLRKTGPMTAVPLAPDTHSKREVTQTCLEAHEILMEVNPANVAKFKDVAKFFAEDLKQL